MILSGEVNRTARQTSHHYCSYHRISLSLSHAKNEIGICLLRSPQWIADHGARVGGTIWLNMPEMGVEGEAQVLGIAPVQVYDVEPGLVTGTFRHTSGDVYDVKLENKSKPIGVTGTHPFWSVDRDTWVSVLGLEIGETLKTLEGTATVESIVRRPGSEPVYNIEVEGDHCYRVGEQGLLVHNASAGDRPNAPSGSSSCDPTVTTATPTEYILKNCLKGGNFIYGELVAGGEVSYLIENLPADGTGCPGYWMFAQMMAHFGSGVNAVQGNWTYGSNLSKINTLTAGGAMTIEQAASQTFTGTNAALFGFTRVVMDPSRPPLGSPGAYTSINLKFTR